VNSHRDPGRHTTNSTRRGRGRGRRPSLDGKDAIMLHRHNLAAASFCVLTLSLACGCSSQGERMVQSYEQTRDTLAESRGQVDATLGTLNNLRMTRGEGLKDLFGQYKDQVGKLETQSQTAKWQAKTMKDDQETHIKAWQKEMESINDPMIKASLESRRKAARSNFALVSMYADDVRKAYEPFLSGNKQLVQALSIDLSPAAILSLGPSMDKVMSDGMVLKERMGAMQMALNNIANGISPLGE
jgi:hypothetical protein